MPTKKSKPVAPRSVALSAKSRPSVTLEAMIHPLHRKFAKLLVEYCTSVLPGENVAITAESPAEPLVRALVREILTAGANPVLRLLYPEYLLDVLELAPDAFFAAEPTLELQEIRALDAWIRVRAPRNSRELQQVDKQRYTHYQKRMQPVQEIRLEHTRWATTLFPTAAGAQDAGMSLDAYEEFVYRAMYLLEEDPVAKWQEVHTFQETLIQHLAQADEIRITAPGTDLTLSVKGRNWINSDGHRNMPSGEVFTGPLETSGNGVITFQVPSSVNGTEVAGITLHLRDGKVEEGQAERGNDLLQAQLETDAGARYLGEIGIGTNYNIQQATKSILFDEKIGGTVHLALGRSYRESGGRNDSAIHWDMICDLRQGGAIYLDGELFQENGTFKL